MLEQTDAQLLRDYAEHRNEAAFRELVQRHADVVYASALRQICSPDLAHDIAQSVFTDLARKAQRLAGTLTGETSLLGWLYRSTRFLALNQLRDDRRRQARERQAMQHFDPASETAPEWERVQPVLDEAMADLSDEDRDALLLRFFKSHDFRAIGAALGVSDDAAQKRVSRALERLRTQLTSRGVTTTVVALSTVLSTNAVPLAPAGLAATLSTAALAGTTLAATTATAVKTIAMTTLQKTVITAAIAVAVGTGIYEARQASRLRSQVQTLQQQQSAPAEQMEQLTRERDDATRQLAVLRDDNERLNRNTAELLKLRGEIGLLRRQVNSNASKSGDRPLSEWLQEYDVKAGDLKPEAQNAIRQMGEKSIPELLSILLSSSSEELPWRVTCAFKALGAKAKTAVPTLVEILRDSSSVNLRLQAAASLGFVGPEAQGAVSALIAASHDKDIPMRMNSIGALTKIGGDPAVLVPVFTASLDDEFWDVRVWAATGLGKFGNQAESAVPKLLEELGKTDNEITVLVAVTKALETIGTTTNNAAPVLLKLFSHPNEGVRTCATNTLMRIDPTATVQAQVK